MAQAWMVPAEAWWARAVVQVGWLAPRDQGGGEPVAEGGGEWPFLADAVAMEASLDRRPVLVS